jgi:antitoxin YefM
VRIIPFSEARAHLKDVLDTVVNERSVSVIRRHGHADVLVMSLADYNSTADTIHLLSNKANRDHLARSIAQFKAGSINAGHAVL